MANFKTEPFGRFIYALALQSRSDRYAHWPKLGDVKKRYKQIFDRESVNAERHYQKARDSPSISLDDTKNAASYYMFRRRDIRRFDYDATITRESTAATLLAFKYVWTEGHLGIELLTSRMGMIPLCGREASLEHGDQSEDLLKRLELLQKGDYIRVEGKGPERKSVILTNRFELESTYLSLLTRDYLASFMNKEGAHVPVGLGNEELGDVDEDELKRHLKLFLESQADGKSRKRGAS